MIEEASKSNKLPLLIGRGWVYIENEKYFLKELKGVSNEC